MSSSPCDPGLICDGNGCEEATETSDFETTLDVIFDFKDGKTSVDADGRDTTLLTMRFMALGDSIEPAPYAQFRLWVDPPEAGTIEYDGPANPDVFLGDGPVPWRLATEAGQATVRFRGCDEATLGCVRFAAIRVAIAPNALIPVASVAVENVGAPEVARIGGGNGGNGGNGGDGGNGGGGGGVVLSGVRGPVLDISGGLPLECLAIDTYYITGAVEIVPDGEVAFGGSDFYGDAGEKFIGFLVYPGDATSWGLDFSLKKMEETFTNGEHYLHATRYPFEDDGRPGLEISGLQSFCNEIEGSFKLHRLDRPQDGTAGTLAIAFKQRCFEKPGLILEGCMHISLSRFQQGE